MLFKRICIYVSDRVMHTTCDESLPISYLISETLRAVGEDFIVSGDHTLCTHAIIPTHTLTSNIDLNVEGARDDLDMELDMKAIATGIYLIACISHSLHGYASSQAIHEWCEWSARSPLRSLLTACLTSARE